MDAFAVEVAGFAGLVWDVGIVMAHFVSLIDGQPGSDQFTLEGDEVQIGRHPDCDIVVEAGAVSRFHAKAVRRGNEWAIEDLGSRNGTFVNGKLLARPHVLREGDRVRISEVELTFRGDSMPEFAGNQHEMTFAGSQFGIEMVDENETEQLSSASKIEFRSGDDGLKMFATPEAKLAALIKINSNLTGAIAIDEVLPKVLLSLFDVFPSADRGFVVTRDADDQLIPRWVQTRKHTDEPETVRISRTIIRQAMQSG
ncbi:MAG: FHA domain-containing protein, partial [Planctomycetota bacterium]